MSVIKGKQRDLTDRGKGIPVNSELIEKLKSIVGTNYVADKEYDLIAYSRAWSYEGPLKADVIIVPGSTDEVSQVMKLANETGTPVTVRAGGTTTTGMALPRHGGIVLDLNRMDKIYGIDEDAQAITLQAGVPVYRMIKYIEQRGWKIPWLPEFGGGVTIGGWAAFNGVGAGGSVYGRVGDFIVGLQVVLPTGEIVRTGSASFKGAKQFTRYLGTGPDLTGLYLNSLGISGVMTEVTMRVYPIPEALDCISFGFDTAEDAQEGMKKLMRANISYGITCVDDEMFKTIGLPPPAPWIVQLFAEGWKEEVEFRIGKARQIIAEAGFGKELPSDTIKMLWGGARGTSLRGKPPKRYFCVGCFHSMDTTAEVFNVYNRVGRKYGMNRGMLWWTCQTYANAFPVYVYDELNDGPQIAAQATKEVRDGWTKAGAVPDYPGPNPDCTPDIVPEYLAFWRRIKDALDPNYIMHRGQSPIVRK